MKTILITGGLGQIGTELSTYLRQAYGTNNVIVTDVVKKDSPVVEAGPFEQLDVTDGKRLAELVDRYHVDTVLHLAALLSAVAEAHPQAAYRINLDGLFQVLEVAREKQLAVFTPSSIGAFGDSTPKVTPQDTIQRPSTMYGVTKVAGELLCDYYFRRFGVDTRGVRFPGLISYEALPGGGTTDYAVEIYYAALKTGKYVCPIAKGTLMDMMYIPDALRAVHELMEADPTKLKHRNAFNIAAMSFAPEDIAAAIQEELPSFTMSYQVNPTLQAIADSWPDKLEDTAAREEWGWKAQYDLKTMTKDMLKNLQPRLAETK
ncbi:L-threonine 3-dehydrogenase [uncultured Murdochiella sp.]|uniref:L-threonine 3-dehydrogenase n=1 Tax=uncultured Murdochiella sp. TaxID=1586095 RepID=UPI0028043825|nr:L-threonine 3-dehydrogenase [uncultured Murdochiella sp.]